MTDVSTAIEQRYLGVTLDGGVRVVRSIGKGVFGWVFEGTTPDGERVAVKVLVRQGVLAAKRFQREIKVMRELPPSPHLARYRGHGATADGSPYLVMDFVAGRTLRRMLHERGAVPPLEACEWMLQICSGFEGLHRLGLAHRDVKPDNIMISVDGAAKVLDFGLVLDSQGLLKLLEEQDILVGGEFQENIDQGLIAGTPEYMSPEQISDLCASESERATNTTADVYGLGVIFYELLSGRRPFPTGPNTTAQSGYSNEIGTYLRNRLCHKDEDLPPIAGAPEALWSIVRKALRHNPKLRQGSAAELSADIRGFLNRGQGIGADEDLNGTDAMDMFSVSALTPLLETSAAPAMQLPEPALDRAAVPRAAVPARRSYRRWVAVAIGVLAAGLAVLALASALPG